MIISQLIGTNLSEDRATSFVGSPGYISPELLLTASCGKRQVVGVDEDILSHSKGFHFVAQTSGPSDVSYFT
jgi:hypothetical protein